MITLCSNYLNIFCFILFLFYLGFFGFTKNLVSKHKLLKFCTLCSDYLVFFLLLLLSLGLKNLVSEHNLVFFSFFSPLWLLGLIKNLVCRHKSLP